MKGYRSIFDKRLYFTCIILFICLCLYAQAAEWKLLVDASAMGGGRFNGWVNQFAFHPTKANIIYAATEGAVVLLSEDGGTNWTLRNEGLTAASEGTVSGYHVRCMAIDPKKPETMYAGMAAFGAFKSIDSGTNWTAMSDALGDTFTKVMAIHPANPEILYLGTDGGGVYRRNVSAGDWTEISEGLKNTYIRAIVMDPKDPKVLYIGSDGGFGKTINGGDLWSIINSGLTTRYILCMAIDPKNPKVLYAGTDGGGMFKTEDGGNNWAPIGGDIWMAKSAADEAVSPGEEIQLASIVSSVVVNPVNPSIVYASNSNGVFRSADAGATWSKMDAGLAASKDIKSLGISPNPPVKVYASTADSKIFIYTEE
jgi:photosystem II stability/assembly factor-like uncharacterized protein